MTIFFTFIIMKIIEICAKMPEELEEEINEVLLESKKKEDFEKM